MTLFPSPANVLCALIINSGHGTDPNSPVETSWPVFVDHLPDKPHQAVCVYNVPGRITGRLMTTGEVLRKSGWQVRVRALNHTEAWRQAAAIAKYLETVHQLPLAVEGASVHVVALSFTGDLLDLGQEPDAERRNNVTFNGTITIS